MIGKPIPLTRTSLDVRFSDVEKKKPTELRAVAGRISRLAQLPWARCSKAAPEEIELLADILDLPHDATYGQFAVAIEHALKENGPAACSLMWALMDPIEEFAANIRARKGA